ncbi:FadR family transcriptional regulator [Flexivirga sp. ID2601S]|uniref:FadR family transcriptional regulator n=1 Tax=Flexivirga aerilata TaxID=1656889 RepID=A0A849AKD2_9MICO|nr:FCD domain-containing protein [Flexivirga aerilata]NNG40287.1 FadR family transcriptional regulator [Flexivirga aerilata]
MNQATSPPLAELVLQPTGANIFEATVRQLATAIRLGVFPDGQQLPPERDLAEQLKVSRMTLREAISALRDAGLVRTTRGRGGGTVVTYDGTSAAAVDRPDATTPRRLEDVLGFRQVVEPGAAALAAGRALDAQQRAWLVDSARECAAAVGSPAYRVADSRLHLAIAAVCGSQMLVDAVTQAQVAVGELLGQIPVLPLNIRHSEEQHHTIVQAILGGDAGAAKAAMQEHCDATGELLHGLVGSRHHTDVPVEGES